MRKVIQAFCLFMCTALVTVQTAQAANPSAANIFNSIGGTTTIDRGGAIHSQARSIYSMGGGMVSFQGKKVSLLAADPPSFSAGCNGISWHFGGFAFISLDEIRQLVEAVAQASLGIAVDLAMQTLCPQCYAVMAKLRDISNLMRNAAADACKIAQNFGAMLKDSGIFPSTSRASDCSKLAAEGGKTSGWMDAAAGQACSLLSSAESALDADADKQIDFLKFGNSGNGSATPSRNSHETSGNVTYKSLDALGYQDGVVKDIMLSLLGMTIYHPKSDVDCRKAFSGLQGSAKQAQADTTDMSAEESKLLANIIDSTSPDKIVSTSDSEEVSVDDVKTEGATPSKGGTAKGPTVCNAPPLLEGIQAVGWSLMCGFNVDAERANFIKSYYEANPAKFAGTSIATMCQKITNQDMKNPWIYVCRKDSAECLEPKMERLKKHMDSAQSQGGYTGLLWMVGDALFDGVKRVSENQPLRDDTKKILSGSGWPLYRLINMGAVYPAMAGQLLEAYASAIAAQYAMDSLDKVMRIGALPAINLKSATGVRADQISVVREQIMEMVRAGNESKTMVLQRIAEKRQMVDVIMQVNKALQAEVIGQGLSGNTQLAVSIKRQAAAVQKQNEKASNELH